MLDIAIARRSECRLLIETDQHGEQVIGFKQGVILAARNVIHLLANIVCQLEGSQQTCLNGVLNIGEIAALAAMAVDHRASPASFEVMNFASTPEYPSYGQSGK